MKKYTKQYRTETTRNENNKKVHTVIYTGDYYEIKKESAKREWFSISAVVLLVLHFTAGILNTQSSRVFYVTLPYAALFLPAVYFTMGAFRFLNLGNRMELPAYEKTVVRMKRSMRGLIWGLGYLLIAETIFLFLSFRQEGLERGELLREIVFLMICVTNFVQIFRNKKNVDAMEIAVSVSSET